MSEPERPKLRRINRGSGHSYTIDGEWAPGVTTIRNILSKPAFIDSAAKKTAAYAIDHWAELVDMTPSERYQTLLKARFLSLNAAAAKGIRVHNLADRYSRAKKSKSPRTYAATSSPAPAISRSGAPSRS
jgi:hypothetical protein